MRLHYNVGIRAWPLAFDSVEQERDFIQTRLVKRLHFSRVILWLAVALHLIFFIRDHYVFTLPQLIHFLRAGLLLPSVLLALYFSYRPQFHQIQEKAVITIASLHGFFGFGPILVGDAKSASAFMTGVLLVMVFTALLSGMRFRYSVWITAFATCIFVTTLLIQSPFYEFFEYEYITRSIMLWIFIVFIAYHFELNERKYFLLELENLAYLTETGSRFRHEVMHDISTLKIKCARIQTNDVLLQEHALGILDRMEEKLIVITEANRLPVALKSLRQLPIDIYQVTSEAMQEYNNPQVTINKQNNNEMKVSGSKTVFVQALQNIINNAIEFSPPESPITLTMQAGTQHVSIQICNAGPCLQEPYHCFTYGVSSRKHTDQSHHGMGLYIVKESIEWMGGQVTADDFEGKGACFTIRLPLITHR
jgi:signal transduction histidine kinase